MALITQYVFSEYTDYSKIQILDDTGVGTTGWGNGANPDIADVLSCQVVVTKPDPITLLPSADPTYQITKNVYYGFAGGVLPNITNVLQDFLASELGYTDNKLLTGIYHLAVSGTGVMSGPADFDFSFEDYFISTGKVDCCITKMRQKASLKECGNCYDKGFASNARRGKAYIDGAIIAFEHALYEESALNLIRANEICDQCVPCRSGC